MLSRIAQGEVLDIRLCRGFWRRGDYGHARLEITWEWANSAYLLDQEYSPWAGRYDEIPF